MAVDTMVAPDNPLTCAEKLAAAHESATLLQASWKVADIVDGALEGAVASTLDDASRHPVAEAAAAEDDWLAEIPGAARANDSPKAPSKKKSKSKKKHKKKSKR